MLILLLNRHQEKESVQLARWIQVSTQTRAPPGSTPIRKQKGIRERYSSKTSTTRGASPMSRKSVPAESGTCRLLHSTGLIHLPGLARMVETGSQVRKDKAQKWHLLIFQMLKQQVERREARMLLSMKLRMKTMPLPTSTSRDMLWVPRALCSSLLVTGHLKRTLIIWTTFGYRQRLRRSEDVISRDLEALRVHSSSSCIKNRVSQPKRSTIGSWVHKNWSRTKTCAPISCCQFQAATLRSWPQSTKKQI